MSALNKSLDELLNTLSNFAESVPASLKSHIRKQVDEARLSLEEGDGLNKLNSINALMLGIMSLQKSNHRVKELININERQTEVEVLYIGTSTGYFLAPDAKTAGRLLLKKGQWQALFDNSLAAKIKLAFSQLDRQGLPQLVKLPVGGEK